MAKKSISIGIARFWTGATAENVASNLLAELEPYYDFTIGDTPDVVLCGQFSGELPQHKCVRVFISLENSSPVMTGCDWAFGLNDHHHPRYMRLRRWGRSQRYLRYGSDYEPDPEGFTGTTADLLAKKTRFCGFVHSSPANYRKSAFRALSNYKRVDAPGQSMRNMAPIPPRPRWGPKIEFLRTCKFVLAFENTSATGYNTEKLVHALMADTVPIYWGDPEIGRDYNTKRFINAHDYVDPPWQLWPRPKSPRHIFDRHGFNYWFYRLMTAPADRLTGAIEQRLWASKGFEALIERIRAIDEDDDLYLRMLAEPVYPGGVVPDLSEWIARWREIFESAGQRR